MSGKRIGRGGRGVEQQSVRDFTKKYQGLARAGNDINRGIGSQSNTVVAAGGSPHPSASTAEGLAAGSAAGSGAPSSILVSIAVRENFDITMQNIRTAAVVAHSYSAIDFEDPTWVNTPIIRSPSVFGADDDLMSGLLGTSPIHEVCKTCGNNSNMCIGHYGVINLPRKVIQKSMIPFIVKLLRILCINSACPIGIGVSTEGSEHLKGIDKLTFLAQLGSKKSSKKSCIHCEMELPVVKSNDDTFINKPINFKDVDVDADWIYNHLEIFEKKADVNPYWMAVDPKKKGSVNMFASVGFSGSKPRNMVLAKMVVIPPMYRPMYHSKDGNIHSHDFTSMYGKIIEYIMKLDGRKPMTQTETPETVYLDMIKVIRAMADNRDGSYVTSRGSSDRKAKGVSELLGAREGAIRENIMGRRVEYTARTVISPDPELDYDQVGIPEHMRISLTTAVKVAPYNIRDCVRAILRGEVRYVSTDLKPLAQKSGIPVRADNYRKLAANLRVGMQIHRFARDGDDAILNRQPTLHRHSMMGTSIKLHQGRSTFTFKPDVATPYNADFDGDEMNIHLVQDEIARAEVRYLMNIKELLINAEDSKATYGLIYDSLIASQMMTQGKTNDKGELIGEYIIPVEVWDRALERLSNHDDLATLDARLKFHNVRKYTGRALFSATLPANLNYDSEGLLIRDGICIKGNATKKHLGTTHHSVLIAIRYHFNGDTETRLAMVSRFFNEFPLVANVFLEYVGYTFGSADVSPSVIPKEIIKRKTDLEEELEKLNQDLVRLSGSDEIVGTVIDLAYSDMEQSKANYLKELKELKELAEADEDPVIIEYRKVERANKEASLLKSIADLDAKMASIRKMDKTKRISYIRQKINAVKSKLKEIPQTHQQLRNKISREALDRINLVIYAKSGSDQKLNEDETKLMEKVFINEIAEATTRIQKQTVQALPPNSAFPTAWESGAKGSKGNASQLVGSISQQYHNAERIRIDRVPYYCADSIDPESAGFCSESFASRNTPQGMISVAIASRDNLIDIGVNTSRVGKLIKDKEDALKDMKVEYDLTFRGRTNGIIYLPLYGGSGVSSESKEIVRVAGEDVGQFINTKRMVLQFNSDFGY